MSISALVTSGMACDPAQEWYNGQPALETHFGITEPHKPRWALMDTE